MAQGHPYTDEERRRSHLPVRSYRAVNVDPITASKPTNADLARGVNQLHACHEDTKGKVEDTQVRVGNIELALGIVPGGKPVAGLSTPWKAFVRTVGATVTAIVALVFVYRFAVTIGPAAWHFLEALNHAILSGKF
jgi:hypothetical protein